MKGKPTPMNCWFLTRRINVEDTGNGPGTEAAGTDVISASDEQGEANGSGATASLPTTTPTTSGRKEAPTSDLSYKT